MKVGNLDAKRDWGFAGDYVRAMWLMLQQDRPADFVVGTGETYSVHEFVEAAFAHVDLDWRPYVRIDPQYGDQKFFDYLMAVSNFLGYFFTRIG